jgi:hypothetical protein
VLRLAVLLAVLLAGWPEGGVAVEQAGKRALGERRANHLINEKSPYLLQHAYNPVEWYPWGPEAFARARREDRPIFLSIGYSTCHWCHVMERESFEDPEVAALLNETFVCIKVDREERPDIDSIYMTVCRMLTGSGGWPLTIIMTPDQKPFFAATYIPKTSRFGRIGMLELIPRIATLWREQREELTRAAERITAGLVSMQGSAGGEGLEAELLERAARELSARYDDFYGGFGTAPKFPTPQNLLFLLRHWRRTGEERWLRMVEHTLQALRRGGIFDQLGFGFHRYSTDREWLTPHFEKMLYDQALLLLAYLEAHQATGKPLYARTAEEIITYMLRDLRDPGGAFHSAEDADSEGEEGKFYLWTVPEVRALLDEESASLFIEAYGLRPGGNFTAEGGGEGRNILHLPAPLEELARRKGMALEVLERRLESARKRLLAAREKRVRPHKDDKVLTDWNGLAIAALARAGAVLGKEEYMAAARQAAQFLLQKLRDDSGRLLHRYRDGSAEIPGQLDDYAFLTWGLIELYETTFEPEWLATALELSRVLEERFWDAERGGFYLTADDAEGLIVRVRQIEEGGIPSGNAVAMLNLLRLARLTGDTHLEELAQRLGAGFSAEVARMPGAYTFLMCALSFAVGPNNEVVITGEPAAADTRALIRAVRSRYLPETVVLFRPARTEGARILELAPFLSAQKPLGEAATAYVCRNFACRQPVTEPARLLEQLAARSP